MRKFIIYITIITAFIQACKEEYIDPPVQGGISNLVVDCIITNDPPPYKVSLTKSVAYNSLSTPPKVTKAKIFITDDLGNVENVIEKPSGSGNYQTSATGMRGEIDRSYKITIELINAKGTITSSYESDWEKLNAGPKVDSTFAEIGSIETLVAQSDGSYVTNTVQGLNLYINATPPAGQDYYYKVNSTDIQQYTQVYYPDTTGRAEGSKLIGRYSQGNMVPEILYGWYSNSITLDKDLKAGTAEFAVPIKNLYIGFLPQFISFQNDTFTDAPISAGAVTITSIYSVSNKIYQIFTEENSQTVPDNTLFDPIPTQLGTNIKCTSDTTQSVLGYFCAASIVRSYHFFLWAEGEKNIFSYKIDSLPVIPPAGIDTSYSPSFWFFTNGEAK